MTPTLKKYNFPDWDNLMAAVGHGGIKEGQIVNRLVEEKNRLENKNKSDEEVVSEIRRGHHIFEIPRGGIKVQGIHDVAVRFSKCCSPVPGDEIVGFITRGRGVSIHRTDCVNVLCMDETDRTRLIDAEWAEGADTAPESEYVTEINIYAGGRQGVVYDISKIFNESEVAIKGMTVRTSKQGKITISMQFGVHSKDQLTHLMAKIRNVEGIIDIERTTG